MTHGRMPSRTALSLAAPGKMRNPRFWTQRTGAGVVFVFFGASFSEICKKIIFFPLFFL